VRVATAEINENRQKSSHFDADLGGGGGRSACTGRHPYPWGGGQGPAAVHKRPQTK
jgi:hypothetical protein